MSTLTVVTVHPLLTAAQGDVGNARVLARRAHLRGIEVDLRTVVADDPLPGAEVYLLGGTEEMEQTELARRLRQEGTLGRAVADGAVVLGVGAGFQVLGEWFDGVDGGRHDGLGVLDVRTTLAAMAEGPVVTYPSESHRLPAMSGFESHRGRTELGAGTVPLAEVQVGTGNGHAGDTGSAHTEGPRHDGAVAGRVVGTYLHGPVLARNPELADRLLSWATGRELDPLPPGWGERVRAQRIAEDLADHSGWGGVKYG